MPEVLIEIAATAQSRETPFADNQYGCAVVPLPFELSVRDREDYFRTILDPPAPPDSLRAALAEYRKHFAK